MSSNEQRRTIWVAVLLFVATALLYAQSAGFSFIGLDDGEYIFNNDHIKHGLSAQGLVWCFQAGYSSNWHPLTWMSHMLDCQLFGINPGPHHLVNALLHSANAALLFLVLKRLTGAFWRSAIVAAFFAWHPLRVESVAWVAERKDVLSAFFWILGLWTYARYTEALPARRQTRLFYAATLGLFVLALMAKPMAITFPFILLLLDWWPLKRLNWRAVFEKVPFFLLAAASALITMFAQTKGGAIVSLNTAPFTMRASNALVCYVRYLEKLFWPADLSMLYALKFDWSLASTLAALGILAAITAVAILLRKTRPYLIVGWLWFFGALVPVIGLVQVGGQSMADRYTYLPCIGILIMLCWVVSDLTENWPARRDFLTVATVITLAACAMATNAQLKYWRNSGTLFSHALAINPNNSLAHGNYACYLRDIGQLEPARLEAEQAVQLLPEYLPNYLFLVGIVDLEGRHDEEIATMRAALKIRPDFSSLRCDLARLLFDKHLYSEAQAELEDGLKLDPIHPGLHLMRARALALQHNSDSEIEFAQSVRLAPQDPLPHYQWAFALSTQRKYPEAIAHYRSALDINPDFVNALANLAWLLCSNPDPRLRNGPEAIELASRACLLTHTNDPIKIETLANAYAEAGRFEEALSWAQKARAVALSRGQNGVAAQNLELQKLYQAHQVFRDF